jgi:hypothetical protein
VGEAIAIVIKYVRDTDNRRNCAGYCHIDKSLLFHARFFFLDSANKDYVTVSSDETKVEVKDNINMRPSEERSKKGCRNQEAAKYG